MTIILFLIDTSASMNQRTFMGTSLMDVAKAAVETFMKIRSRDPNSRWDRYMLLTFEDPPANVKAGWKESHATFMSELKNLHGSCLSMMGPAIKNAFDLLNINRMQSGIDTYGQGRSPFYLEPAVIIVITDGGHLTTNNGVHPELNLPMNNVVPGTELTKEPFRWDQRIFSLVLRLSGSVPPETPFTFIPNAETHPIDAMCEVTGGRSYAIYTQKMLNAALESLVQKVQSGVVINFEKIGSDPPPLSDGLNSDSNGNLKENQDINKPVISDKDLSIIEEKKSIQQQQQTNVQNLAWQNCRRLIYVPRSAQKGYSVGHWPIPESYWPDPSSPTLPPRTAHPIVRFSCSPCDPIVIENLPFDKYELEPSPLTQYILERRQPNSCWQVFIGNSAKFSDICHPFGYLKASSALSCVNLFVMPYNFPILLPLLEELFKVHKLKPTPKWRQQFDNYLKTMPGYYAGPLRRALARMGASNLVPDNMDNCLSYSIITYLKKLKNQAKIEMDRLIASVGQVPPATEGIKVDSRTTTSFVERKDFNQLMKNMGSNMSGLKQELQEYSSFTIAVADKEIKPQYYRNPYDIPRTSLLDQITRMRMNFLQSSHTNTKVVDEDQLHSIPVQQMGNYQEYLKKLPSPLRELESAPVRLHMFGNPFKVNKAQQNFMTDEVDDAMFGTQQSKKRPAERPPPSPGPQKRKPGPLPRDIPIRRPITPPPTPPASPLPTESQIEEPLENEAPVHDAIEENGELLIVIDEDSPPKKSERKSEVVKSEVVNSVMPNHTLKQDGEEVNSVHSKLVNSVERTSPYPTTRFTNKKRDSQLLLDNTKLRDVLCKEVRRPGRNYEKLFNTLTLMQGSLEIRCLFIRDIIREATRFKKKLLIRMLEDFERNLVNNAESSRWTAKTYSTSLAR
ncbi:integrator complex subunit 6-like [Gigantopelta aegis]|uniref:integrator complex subunit 6-like n=1 Tax=Gigantopelta aegis TaxID=1735272 RepID=UPI001B88B7A7|nr:integrator complex subunit 6-like [Gigantopelta aegis]